MIPPKLIIIIMITVSFLLSYHFLFLLSTIKQEQCVFFLIQNVNIICINIGIPKMLAVYMKNKKELVQRPIPKNASHSFLAAYNAVA